MLLASDLPNAVLVELRMSIPGWLFWVRMLVLVFAMLFCLMRDSFRRLLLYFLLLFVLNLLLFGFTQLRSLPQFLAWEKTLGWSVAMLVFQGMKLVVTVGLIAVMLGLGWKRADFLLRIGDLSAIGIRLGTIKVHWKWFAVTCGLIILPLTLLFFGGADLPSGDKLTRVLPLLPFAVLGAALNAFNEEMQFRAPFLNLLRNQFGSGQAILLTSVLFGMMHYIGGSPAGLPGFLITFALGALFAKAELETQGLYAGWLIHFCQNVVIYSFWALGAV
jgi:membrane protease YdiL (CAAX protease family)